MLPLHHRPKVVFKNSGPFRSRTGPYH